MAELITFVIDISHHQDRGLDLARSRRDGCELCLMKAGEGSSFVDPDFASNLAEARAAGQLVGAYWYQRANASAAAHVAKIKQVVPRDVPVILDVEANSGGIPLTREILRLLTAEGYRTPLLYIPRWYWQQIGSPSLAGLPPLWSSRYPNNRVGPLSSEWSEVPAHYWNGYGGLAVALLQFTSSARIAGYQPLDASAFRGTRAQLAALMGGQTQEDDMQLTDTLATWNGTRITVENALAGAIGHAEYIEGQMAANQAALMAAIAALSTDPDITVDKMREIVNTAVKQHVQITGDVRIGPAQGAGQ